MRPVDSKYPVTLGYRQKAQFNPNYIHRGIDYGVPAGTNVMATTGGTVVYAADARRASAGSYGPAYGIQVIIKVNSIYCLYAHLSQTLVKVGQSVSPGQVIGRSGATGNVTGAHLHYQENTKPPAAYTSDRKPLFIDSQPVKPVIHPVDKNGAWVVDTEVLNGRDFPSSDWGKVITTQPRGKKISTTQEVLLNGVLWVYRPADTAWYSTQFLKRTYFPQYAERKNYIVSVSVANIRNAPNGAIIRTAKRDSTFSSVGYEVVDDVTWLVNSKYEWTVLSNLKLLVKVSPPEAFVSAIPEEAPTPNWLDKLAAFFVRIK